MVSYHALLFHHVPRLVIVLFHSIETELETMASQYGITVSWNNPFTTDLSFCVDAKSAESSETVVSECVSGTRYVFTSLDSHLCEDLSFTVTPTVTVEGVQMNGTSSKPVVGYFHGRRGTMCIESSIIIWGKWPGLNCMA